MDELETYSSSIKELLDRRRKENANREMGKRIIVVITIIICLGIIYYSLK